MRTLTLTLFLTILTACAGAVTLEHRMDYSRKGTRSESRHGFLLVNGQAIPDVFSFVQQGDQAWEFFSRRHLWGDDGYHATHVRVTNLHASEPCTSRIMDRGWYPGSDRLDGTPGDWLFVRWGTNTAWIAPTGISALVTAKTPPKLKRTSQEEMFRD